MTNSDLAKSYLKKRTDRLDVLDLLLKKGAYSDVVREAQEIVELGFRGMLRYVGIEPPKYHDVGPLLIEYQGRFRDVSSEDIMRLAKISKELRRERELAFYGDIDFIPTDEYKQEDAMEAIEGAKFVVATATEVVQKGKGNGRRR
ncbi:MAG: HEPN domain-containing protein [Syntrophaceae bacterium]|nr:HEPN domain-containing protein [Syntrophaceae bacterium]